MLIRTPNQLRRHYDKHTMTQDSSTGSLTPSSSNTPEKRAELRRAALEYHQFPTPGKIAIAATKQMVNQHCVFRRS